MSNQGFDDIVEGAAMNVVNTATSAITGIAGKLKAGVTNWMESWKAEQQIKANLAEYRKKLAEVLYDRALTPQELKELAALRNEFGLSPEEAHRIHREAIYRVSEFVLVDGIITDDEFQLVAKLSELLGVDCRSLPSHHLQAYNTKYRCMQIANGHMPALSNSILRERKGEVVHAQTDCAILEERVISRQWVSGSSGMRIRICKGVSWSFGGTRGRSVPVKDVVVVSTGVLCLTNQRIAFVGNNRSINLPWDSLLSAEPLSDGIWLCVENRVKPILLRYADPNESEYFAYIMSQYVH